ncbi:hypothetical protein SNEBB_009103 [Seison nebaliae]|nr:hypothetical protein SNEBB_009103 [Seison nebaliae]
MDQVARYYELLLCNSFEKFRSNEMIRNFEDKNELFRMFYQRIIQKMLYHLKNTKIHQPDQLLYLCSKYSLFNLATYIFDYDNDIHPKLYYADESGDTPLLMSTKFGDIPMMELLLENGANPNCENILNRSPLMYASRLAPKISIESVKILLEYGADINYTTALSTTCLLAVDLPNIECFNLLLKQTVDYEKKMIDGNSLLHQCVVTNRIDYLKKLMQQNIHINSMNWRRESALYLAVNQRNHRIIQLLLKNPSISINHRNRLQQSALILASKLGDMKLLNLLFRQSKTDSTTYMDCSPRDWIKTRNINNKLQHSLNRIERQISRRHIQLRVQDLLGLTALHSAAMMGHRSVCELLLKVDDMEIQSMEKMKKFFDNFSESYRSYFTQLSVTLNYCKNVLDDFCSTIHLSLTSKGRRRKVYVYVDHQKIFSQIIDLIVFNCRRRLETRALSESVLFEFEFGFIEYPESMTNDERQSYRKRFGTNCENMMKEQYHLINHRSCSIERHIVKHDLYTVELNNIRLLPRKLLERIFQLILRNIIRKNKVHNSVDDEVIEQLELHPFIYWNHEKIFLYKNLFDDYIQTINYNLTLRDIECENNWVPLRYYIRYLTSVSTFSIPTFHTAESFRINSSKSIYGEYGIWYHKIYSGKLKEFKTIKSFFFLLYSNFRKLRNREEKELLFDALSSGNPFLISLLISIGIDPQSIRPILNTSIIKQFIESCILPHYSTNNFSIHNWLGESNVNDYNFHRHSLTFYNNQPPFDIQEVYDFKQKQERARYTHCQQVPPYIRGIKFYEKNAVINDEYLLNLETLKLLKQTTIYRIRKRLEELFATPVFSLVDILADENFLINQALYFTEPSFDHLLKSFISYLIYYCYDYSSYSTTGKSFRLFHEKSSYSYEFSNDASFVFPFVYGKSFENNYHFDLSPQYRFVEFSINFYFNYFLAQVNERIRNKQLVKIEESKRNGLRIFEYSLKSTSIILLEELVYILKTIIVFGGDMLYNDFQLFHRSNEWIQLLNSYHRHIQELAIPTTFCNKKQLRLTDWIHDHYQPIWSLTEPYNMVLRKKPPTLLILCVCYLRKELPHNFYDSVDYLVNNRLIPRIIGHLVKGRYLPRSAC